MKRLSMIRWYVLLLAIVSALSASAQRRPFRTAPVQQTQRPVVMKALVVDGDTLPYMELKEVCVHLLTPNEIKKNQLLIHNIKKMLPYAQVGRKELDELEIQLSKLPKKKQKEVIKAKEKEITDRYTAELKKCTFKQGLVLLKLIDRETGKTSYTIVNELRGKVRASFYQTFARMFKFNLKSGFDPRHDKQDDLIDRICVLVERGLL